MKGKNKLVPRLLGVTRESVMRVDEKTKEVTEIVLKLNCFVSVVIDLVDLVCLFRSQGIHAVISYILLD